MPLDTIYWGSRYDHQTDIATARRDNRYTLFDVDRPQDLY